MSTLELVLGLLVVAVVLGRVGRGLATPTPVLLVIAGLLIGVFSRFIPGAPEVVLQPDLVFFVFLPPLLASGALNIPFGPFQANLRPIAALAVGLVLVTMAAVGFVVHAIAPAIPLASALALGAIVAPPDPVAATSVARSLGLPNRLVTILEGEGLVNDATALVAYQVAVTAVTTGYFSWSEAGARFVVSGSVGVGAGLALGWAGSMALRKAVFILVGLEIGQLAAEGMPPGTLRAVALVSAVVIWVRLGWMFVVPLILRLGIPRRVAHGIPPVRGLAVLGWAGMRGVVSLAAALAIPLHTADGTPFPARGEIILLTFGVIFATLVLQGLTLRPLVRALGMADPDAPVRERLVARRAAVGAARRHIQKMLTRGEISRREARLLQRSLTPVSRDDLDSRATMRRARSEVLEVERRVIHQLVQAGEIGDETAQHLEEALDIQTMGLHVQGEHEAEWKRRKNKGERSE